VAEVRVQEEVLMSRADRVLIIAASILILFVDWLAFHDVVEVHTVRDWLMLLASALVLTEFARLLWRSRRHAR
jgi:hypothetical protein